MAVKPDPPERMLFFSSYAEIIAAPPLHEPEGTVVVLAVNSGRTVYTWPAETTELHLKRLRAAAPYTSTPHTIVRNKQTAKRRFLETTPQ